MVVMDIIIGEEAEWSLSSLDQSESTVTPATDKALKQLLIFAWQGHIVLFPFPLLKR